eukprot:gene32225-40516_t
MVASRVRKPVSLAAANRGGFLAAAAKDNAAVTDVSAWIAGEVAYFAARVGEERGVVDLINTAVRRAVGHRFGATRPLPGTHRAAAVTCAHRVARPPDRGNGALRSAVSISTAPAGDPLTAVRAAQDAASPFQRPMSVGGVASFVVVAERLAATWRP